MLGCPRQRPVECPEAAATDKGRGQKVGVDPADASTGELSAHHEAQHLVVRDAWSGRKELQIRDHRGLPGTQTAENQLAQDPGVE